MISTTTNRLDSRTWKILSRVLSQVKESNGWVDTDTIWPPDPIDAASTPLDDASLSDARLHLQSLSSLLNDLTASRDALRALLQSAEKGIAHLQAKADTLALQCAIHSLPNELLARVFEAGYSPDALGNAFSVSVSHVCQRFRSVALRTPRLWSAVCDNQSRTQLETFLTRSKTMQLTIFINECGFDTQHHRRQPLTAFMNTITAHSERWCEFRYIALPFLAQMTDLPTLSAYPGLELPSLSRLTFANFASNDLESEAFYAAWQIQNLTGFRGGNAALEHIAGTRVISCDLFFNVQWDMERLFDALDGLPLLQHLTLEFGADFAVENDTDAQGTRVILRDLTSLSVTAACEAPHVLLAALRPALHTPRVEEVTLQLRSPGLVDITALVAALLRTGPRCPRLNTLRLATGACIYRPGPGAPDAFALLRRLPALAHLVLEAPHAWLADLAPAGPAALPPLRTLTLRHCDHVAERVIGGVLALLRQNPAWADFVRLRIVGCRGLSAQFLQVMKEALGDRLEYSL